MRAQQWYLLGGVMLTLGLVVLVVSQIVLWKWLKTWKKE